MSKIEKLELRHLAGYLPYGLKLANNEFGYWAYNGIVLGESDPINLGRDIYSVTRTDKYKPLLRPISDLIKEIEHNGERFVPSKKLIEFAQNELIDVASIMHYFEIVMALLGCGEALRMAL